MYSTYIHNMQIGAIERAKRKDLVECTVQICLNAYQHVCKQFVYTLHSVH